MSYKKENIGEHLTIAFDVADSRLYPDKMTVWEKLKELCDELNEIYDEGLKVQFYIKDGDSVVGVLKNFPTGFKIYQSLRQFALNNNMRFYFGMGFGTLDTMRVLNVNEINGSSVINAFSAINYAKEIQLTQENPVSFFAFDDSDIIPFKTLNSIVSLIYNEFNGRTQKQKEVINLIEKNSKLTYEEIGMELGYPKQNVKENISKLLSRADYNINKDLKRDVFDLLKKLQTLLKESFK